MILSWYGHRKYADRVFAFWERLSVGFPAGRTMRHTITILLILSLMMIACADGPDQKGRTYESLNELVGAQQKIGFVRLGRFGNHWPAEIVEVKTSLDEIKFSLQSGAKHTYPGYYGYELKMIRLKSADDSETVVVFRSKETK